MKKLFLLLPLLSFAGTLKASEVCQSNLVRPNGEILHDFYAEGISLDDACPDSLMNCERALYAVLNSEDRDTLDLRYYDAQCKVVTDWTRPIPTIVIRPSVRVQKTDTVFCSREDRWDICSFSQQIPALNYVNFDWEVLSVKLSDGDRGCRQGDTWGLDRDLRSRVSGVWLEGRCKFAQFEVTYTHLVKQ